MKKRVVFLLAVSGWSRGRCNRARHELGDYDQAFDAFDTMAAMRPSAAAYARVSHGRELRGDLDGALEARRNRRD